jgi:hypothetical protein
VELLIGKRRQTTVDVGVNHINPATDAGQNRLFVNFNTQQPPVAALAESSQQPASAATRIQDAGVGRNQLDDRVVVDPVVAENAGGRKGWGLGNRASASPGT